jgi:Chitobiase/beta-hexosaminidase C-terminal domain
MGRFTGLGSLLAIAFSLVIPASLQAQVNVATYHNDNARSGANTQETILTPLNVNSTNFGRLYTVVVDGYVYSQPLVVANVQIQGGVHNVLYIATEHDSLYAMDADSGAIYWQAKMIPVGATTVSSTTGLMCGDLSPESGISGTPVIDLNTRTIYLVTASQVNSVVSQYLHALDIQTGTEKFGAPTLIQASVPGTASDGNGTTVSFAARQENQRAGLLLDNGHVVIGFSSHCDIDPWHGWVLSYSASSLGLEAAFNASPGGRANGVWMSGSGPATDAAGNIYVVTGNGSWNGTTDYGDSIVKLSPPANGAFNVVDYFTPFNQVTLSNDDMDVSSGGLTLLPTLPSGKQLLVQMGKEGKIYLLDQNNLGKYCAVMSPACSGKDTQIVQEISQATVGVWGAPAYWNGSVYWGAASELTGTSDFIKAFSFNANGSGLLSVTPTSHSTNAIGFPGLIPSISANGTSGGILWGLDNNRFAHTCKAGVSCQILYAYDAGNLANMLYNSTQAANFRDVPGSAVKFTTPTVANGKVYVGSQNAVSAYGLLGTFIPTAPPPTFSPSSGSFTSSQSIALSDSLSTAVIHYTTNGATPNASSAVYGGSLHITQTTTIQAIAVASGFLNSAVSAATYTLNSQSGVPVDVSFGSSSNVYAIFSNGSPVTNGGMDTQGYAYSENLLGSSIVWSGATFNLGSAGVPSAINSATLPLPAGNYSALQVLGAAVQGNHVKQVFVVNYTDGTSDSFTQSMSDWTTPQSYPGEAKAVTMAYRVRNLGTTLTGPVYVYGYTFALNPAKTVASVALPKNRDIVILAMALTPVGGTPPPNPAPTPTISPSSGSFTTSQMVTLTDSLSTAAIHYTTDGSTPSASSALYSGTLQITQTTTIRAIAIASGFLNSAVSSATYTLNSQSGGSVVNVSFGSAANVYAIFSNGSPVTNGGMDTQSYAYSENLIGTSIVWSGATFNLGSAGVPSALNSATLALPAGNFSALQVLGAAVQGNHVKQVFVVTYTDGTSDSFTQSMSDWTSPQNYPDEAKAMTMTYRVRNLGTTLNGSAYVYGYSFPINPAKTVASLKPPNNRDVVLLSIVLRP